MAADTNTVVLAGRLTRDPEQGAQGPVKLGLAVNGSKKNPDGSWEDVPNFFDVDVWGPQGDNVIKYLGKGSQIVVTGKLKWSQWEKEGRKQSKVTVSADRVQFVGAKAPGTSAPQSDAFTVKSDVPMDNDFSTGTSSTEDIPF